MVTRPNESTDDEAGFTLPTFEEIQSVVIATGEGQSMALDEIIKDTLVKIDSISRAFLIGFDDTDSAVLDGRRISREELSTIIASIKVECYNILQEEKGIYVCRYGTIDRLGFEAYLETRPDLKSMITFIKKNSKSRSHNTSGSREEGVENISSKNE